MKTIIITGAGTGIGAATAGQLAKDSSIRLVLIGRRKEKLEEVKENLPNPDQHLVLATDISKKEQFAQDFASINPERLNIFGLFANAGIGGENHYGKDDRWDDIININLTGTYITIMEVLPYLKKSKEDYKNIMITSSCLARFGVPNYTAYIASKTGLLGLMRGLAVELAPSKVLVNAILPGWVETEMEKESIQNLADRQHISYEDSYKQQMGYVLTGKMSQPEEIGKVVTFFLTNQETSITGQGIDVNNGAWMG